MLMPKDRLVLGEYGSILDTTSPSPPLCTSLTSPWMRSYLHGIQTRPDD